MPRRSEAEVVMQVMAEGGSLEVTRVPDRRRGQWKYLVSRNERALADLLADEGGVENAYEETAGLSWEQATTMLSQWPWHRLHPRLVHPAYREEVLRLVAKRGGAEERARWEQRLEDEARWVAEVRIDGQDTRRAARHPRRPGREASQAREPEQFRPPAWSPALDRALTLAAAVHYEQKRKGTQIPYITHPVQVASILDRHGWPPYVIVAGVLHDVLEDVKAERPDVRRRVRDVFGPLASMAPLGAVPSRPLAPGEPRLPLGGESEEPAAFRRALAETVRRSFGERVLELVEHVTEQKTEGGQERPWFVRKLERLESLKWADRETAALKAADLLHNVEAIARDLRDGAPGIRERFNAPLTDLLWSYGTASALVLERLGRDDALASELNDAFRRLEEIVAGETPPGSEFEVNEIGPEALRIAGRDGQRIYGIEQWLEVAPPRKGGLHWQDGRSAKELARAWFASVLPAVPKTLQLLFDSHPETAGLRVATALAEWKTRLPVPGEGRNHDLLLLGTVGQERVVVGVEAKADEEFGPVTAVYRKAAEETRNAEPPVPSRLPERIDELSRVIFARDMDEIIGALRYQLLHGTAGTVLEARRRGARLAVFAVHEFRSGEIQEDRVARNHADLEAFLTVLSAGATAQLQPSTLVGPFEIGESQEERVSLFIGKVVTELDEGRRRR